MAAGNTQNNDAGGDVLADLRDRLRRAATDLEQLADEASSDSEALRLVAKAAGVDLARSYVEEAIRDAAAREVI